MSERDVNGVESLHVALTTKGSRVGSEISHPSPPQPVVAPQSKGSENEIKTKLFSNKIRNQKNFTRLFTVRRRDVSGAETILLEACDDGLENSGVEVRQQVRFQLDFCTFAVVFCIRKVNAKKHKPKIEPEKNVAQMNSRSGM